MLVQSSLAVTTVHHDEHLVAHMDPVPEADTSDDSVTRRGIRVLGVVSGVISENDSQE